MFQVDKIKKFSLTFFKIGSLSSILSVFSKYSINLSAIESYPDKINSFQYGFFLEFQGHATDSRVAQVLQEIETNCTFVALKGSFQSQR